MISNRLVQVVLLSACCSLTIPAWASSNAAENGVTPARAKKVPATTHHFPGDDWHKQHPKKSFPGQDWKNPPKNNHAMPRQNYPEPDMKPTPQSKPKLKPNYPEPQM